MLTEKTVDSFLSELSSSSPAPGGGSVAALAAALGCALTSMVCRLTIGKKKYVEVQAEMESVLQEAEDLRLRAGRLIDTDTEAFQKVMDAFALPKESEEERAARLTAIESATQKATLVPLQVMRLVQEASLLSATVAEKGNRNSLSDTGVAALMLLSACRGAQLNVEINLSGLQDRQFIQTVTEESIQIASQVEERLNSTLQAVNRLMKG